MAAYEVLLLNTVVPQIQAAQAGDTYIVPRDIQITANLDVTGNTILGNASTDTVRVNGYMGVGGAPGASTAITVAPTALTGTLQYGVSSQPTGTSAATNSIIAFDAFAQVANAVFTVNNVYGLSVRAGSKGASATATNWHGIQIADQTQGTNNYGITSLVSSGTDKWNIYASGTAANYFAGDLRVGTTTAFASEKLSVFGSTFNDLAAGNGSANTSYDWLVGVSGNVVYPAKIVVDQGSSSTIHGMSFYTSNATLPTEKVRIAADGNVGIGTSSPNASLDINRLNSSDNSNVPTLRFTDADTSSGAGQKSGQIEFSTSDATPGPAGVHSFINGQTEGTSGLGALVFGTGLSGSASEKMRIDSSGNLGLGVTPSAWSAAQRAIQFTANGSVASSATYPISLSSNAVATSNGWAANYIADGFATLYAHGAGQHRWFNAPSGTAGNAITFTERASIGLTEMVVNEPGADYDFRVESDTNTHALFVEGTNSNVKIGGSAERATTVGTNHLDIFNGTAPVGTLANGISIYSSSGEAYVMDAAGNATLFSPHDAETNEWIFKSKHTPTGKVLKIDVEKLLRFVNDHFGLDAVQEFIED